MDRKIEWEIKQLHQLISRQIDRQVSIVVKDIGLTRMQSMVLGFIHMRNKQGDVLQKDIEQEFCIRRSTATVLLQALEKKELIYREESFNDKRIKYIRLTKKADDVQEEIEKKFQCFHQWLKAELTLEEEQAFFCLADKLKQRLQKEEEESNEGTHKTN